MHASKELLTLICLFIRLYIFCGTPTLIKGRLYFSIPPKSNPDKTKIS